MDTIHPIDPEHSQLAARLAAEGVEYVLGGWIDVMGRSKSKVVPISHLPHLLAGSERYTPRGMGDLGRMTPDEDECVGLPDLATLTVCPWDRRVAWMAADLSVGRPGAVRPVHPLGAEAPGGVGRGRGPARATWAWRPSCSCSSPSPSAGRTATWSP